MKSQQNQANINFWFQWIQLWIQASKGNELSKDTIQTIQTIQSPAIFSQWLQRFFVLSYFAKKMIWDPRFSRYSMCKWIDIQTRMIAWGHLLLAWSLQIIQIQTWMVVPSRGNSFSWVKHPKNGLFWRREYLIVTMWRAAASLPSHRALNSRAHLHIHTHNLFQYHLQSLGIDWKLHLSLCCVGEKGQYAHSQMREEGQRVRERETMCLGGCLSDRSKRGHNSTQSVSQKNVACSNVSHRMTPKNVACPNLP